MFSGAVKFNQPLYKWKISAETNRENMFAGAVAYNSWIGMNQVLALDCCLYRNDIPVELWQIIHSYHFKPIVGSDDIAEAVTRWCEDSAEIERQQCELKYGHISQWNEGIHDWDFDMFGKIRSTLVDLTGVQSNADTIRQAGLFPF
jgi:hypothetical protein